MNERCRPPSSRPPAAAGWPVLPGILLAAFLVSGGFAALSSGCSGSPPDFTGGDADSLFRAVVIPVLQDQCGDCHFPGGPMHARMPFDDREQVGVLEDEMTIRLTGRGRDVVAAWLRLDRAERWAADTLRAP